VKADRADGRRAVWITLIIPALLVGRALGPYKAPGMGTEMLHGQLFAAAQVEDWLGGGVGQVGAALGAGQWWPDQLLPVVAAAGLGVWFDSGLAYGLVVFAAVWLCGFGPYRLMRARWPDLASSGCLAAALLVQASPPVLRAVWSGEIGVLGVGPAALVLALAMSGARARLVAVLALLAGAWGTVAALSLAIAAGLLRRPALLLALVPLGVALSSPPSALPGAARLAPVALGQGPAYVAANRAVLPLPPDEAAALRPAPNLRAATAEQVSGDGGVPGNRISGQVARLPGGLAIWLVSALGLVLGPRGPASAALLCLCAWFAVFGLLPMAGAPPPLPPAWLERVAPWLPGLRPPIGGLAWLLPALLVAPLAAAHRWRPLPLAGLCLLTALLENPRLSLPVSNLAPDPVAATLSGLEGGNLVVFPSPAPPWRQGGESAARLLTVAIGAGHAVEVGLRPPSDAALMGELSILADMPVDLEAGPVLWATRGGDPLEEARRAGFTALLIDERAVASERLPAIDGWLASRVGVAVARHEGRALYDLRPLDARPAPQHQQEPR
jgi:hypothetical protein